MPSLLGKIKKKGLIYLLFGKYNLVPVSKQHLKEDKLYGRNRRGDEIPEELAYQETRLKKIKEAKAALEAEARLAREEGEKKKDDDNKSDPPATPPRFSPISLLTCIRF